MFRKYSQKGFTLVELLVVIGIFAVLTSVIFSILVTVLRGSKKSEAIVSVRRVGDHAAEQMIKKLRFAKSLDFPSPYGGASPACSGAGTTVRTIRITNSDLTQSIFSCPASSTAPNSITRNGADLTNRNEVVVSSCSFECRQSYSSPPTIKINFILTKINNLNLPEGDTAIPFQSSVTLRNVSSL